VHDLPVAETRRQVTPGDPRSIPVKNGFDEQPVVRCIAADMAIWSQHFSHATQHLRPKRYATLTPRFNTDIWEKLVAAHRGNTMAAKITADRLLKREADRLQAER
jgi:hypothetical protein